MRLSVRTDAGEVQIEVSGLAGRQQQLLRALATLRDGLPAAGDQPQMPPANLAVAVRAGSDAMKIRIRPAGDVPFQADAIYSWLRRTLIEPTAVPQASGAVAGA
jgi:hypothetical protein